MYQVPWASLFAVTGLKRIAMEKGMSTEGSCSSTCSQQTLLLGTGCDAVADGGGRRSVRLKELAHEKRGLAVFSVILRKTLSKIVVQNFTILQVCAFVFELYDAAHALPCFV